MNCNTKQLLTAPRVEGSNPSPTFPFEECIVSGREEEEEEEEDSERVNREERGRWRRHSNQERLRERLSVRFKDD